MIECPACGDQDNILILYLTREGAREIARCQCLACDERFFVTADHIREITTYQNDEDDKDERLN